MGNSARRVPVVDLGLTPGSSGPEFHLYPTLCPTLSGLGEGTNPPKTHLKGKKVFYRAMENYGIELRLSQTEEVQCRFHTEEIGSH